MRYTQLMADERLQGPETADLPDGRHDDTGRQSILDVFIIGLFVLTAAAVVLSLSQLFHSSYAGAAEDSVASIIVLVSLAAIWLVNRRGHPALATWLCLALVLLVTTLFFDGTIMDRLFIIYALPVVSTAFLLWPGAAFLSAGLCVTAYTVTWAIHDREPGYNYLSLLILAGLALVSYLVASYWRQSLEVQEEYRRELEQDVREREQTEDELRARERELEDVADQLRTSIARMVDAMVAAVELHDPATAGHQRRVARLSQAIGRELGLSRLTMDSLRMAAVLHDVGMATVPVPIVSKPGPLSPAEYDVVKRHPELARPILERLEFGGSVADIVMEHHERVDGSGYPRGLQGDGIRREARVIAVADSVEAMLAGRPYRPALSLDDVRVVLQDGSGSLYDPEVVDATLRVLQGGFVFED